MKSLYLLFVSFLFVVGCNNSPTEPVSTSPIGTWQYVETIDLNGVEVAMVVTFTVSTSNTYQAMAIVSDGGNTITLHQEQGTWSISNSSVTFTPSSCKDYDETSQLLVTSECSDNSIFIISATTMTDGSIIMNRK
jgi:hypothetical protein